ncbi:fibronectin type III domain-containing protein, partial [Viridibacillus arvi]|uniref:fibronectin type III domain-containing protein n=1 Tax=Viridibacillus arvi TaxID=263475 RepID=UPI0034CDFB9D
MKKQTASKRKNKKAKMITGVVLAPLSVGIVATTNMQFEASADTVFIDIHNASELQAIKGNPKGSYRLVNDIDLTGVNWTPFDFQGVLDANGFKIKNLTLNHYGLFSTINNGVVKNLTIENFNITFNAGNVGALAGKTENSTIENVKVLNSKVKGTYEVGLLTGSTKNTTVKRVMAEGTVNGTADTGGLIGTSYANNTIENAYTNAIVNNSGDRTGGVVGYIKDTLVLKNVYSTSAVKGRNMVGGIVGSHDSTQYITGLTNVYALNSLVEGTGTAIGNIFGFSYRQITSTAIARDDIKGNSSNRYLKQLISQTDVENGLVGFEDSSIWKQDPVTKLPIFVEQENLPGEVPTYASRPTILKDDEGTFKPIYTITDLKNITLNNDNGIDRYKLMNDLDFEGVEWIPFELKTQFNGNGFTVKNLKLNYYGLFSTINNNGSVKNLTIENFNITSSSGTVGTLAGKTENATIENVKVLNSKVKGTYEVGLLTGSTKNTTVKRVMAEGTVNGTADTGGLIGTSYTNNTIENAYTNAIVNNSGDRTGGVVGYIKDNLALKNVYSTSAVKGKNMVGGIVGSHDSTLYLTGLTNVYALNSLVEGTGTAIGNVFGFSYRQIAFTTVAREDIRGNGSNDFTKQLINQADVDNGLVGFEDPSIWKQDETTKLPIFVEQDEFPGDIPIYIGSKPVIPTPKEFKVTERGYNDLTLSWQGKNNELVEGFMITRDGQEIAQIPFDANTENHVYKDKNLTHGTSYDYEITVMYKGDLGKPSKLTESTLSVDKPTNVVLKKATDKSLSFTWDTVDIATEYIILRNDVEIARVTEPAFMDEGLKSSTSYKYKVITVSPYGNSQPTEITAQTTEMIDAIPTPDEFKITEHGYNDLTLGWQIKDNEMIEGFIITRDGQEIAQVPFEADTKNYVYKDKNLTHGTSYAYEITVMFKGDLGKPSKLTDSTLSVAKPTVVLKNATDQSLSFTWEPVDISTEYIILRNDVEIARVTEPNFIDEGLKPNTSYKYKVIAVSPYGNSQPSEITAKTSDKIDVPNPKIDATIKEKEVIVSWAN